LESEKLEDLKDQTRLNLSIIGYLQNTAKIYLYLKVNKLQNVWPKCSEFQLV